VLQKPFRRIGLPLLSLVAVFVAVAALRSAPLLEFDAPVHVAASDAALSAPLVSLLGARQWLNTQPLQPESLRGKVVLVNFWTFSCINCLRMLPHVREWAAKYKDRGLVVIGVQTPEFAFEKDVASVSKALMSLDVSYPVAIDNDFKIWQAFENVAWPALYFIGADGRIRRHVFGEGGYDESEKFIQQLLSEANASAVTNSIVAVGGQGPEAAADIRDLRSPETYVGYSQAMNFASPGLVSRDTAKLYRTEPSLPLNHWSLAGLWTIRAEFAVLSNAPGSIIYRFHARDLHLVLASAAPGRLIRFRVTIDGKSPGSDHGFDVDADGWGTLQEDRLYQLVRQSGAILDRTFRIEFLDAGVRAYSFTFG
jgi:thiol-disulfide isomerase/thioredoxin